MPSDRRGELPKEIRIIFLITVLGFFLALWTTGLLAATVFVLLVAVILWLLRPLWLPVEHWKERVRRLSLRLPILYLLYSSYPFWSELVNRAVVPGLKKWFPELPDLPRLPASPGALETLSGLVACVLVAYIVNFYMRERPTETEPTTSPAGVPQQSAPTEPPGATETREGQQKLRIYLANLPTTGPDLFGREEELETLDQAWEDDDTNIVSLVAFGGVGKTALVNRWLRWMRKDTFRGAERAYAWSFYSQGAAEGKQVSADPFIADALKWFGDPDPTEGSVWDKAERLAELIRRQRTLLILDGLEPLQNPPGERQGSIKDPGLKTLLRELANHNPGLCVITTRLEPTDLEDFFKSSVKNINLEELSKEAGAELLASLEVNGTDEELRQAAEEFGGHALALTLLGSYLKTVYNGDIRKRDRIPALIEHPDKGGHAKRVMRRYEQWFKGKPELDILRIMGLFDRPAEKGAIEAVHADSPIEGLTTNLQGLLDGKWKFALDRLRKVRLLSPADDDEPDTLDCHPLVREHFGEQLKANNPTAWKEAHSRLYEHYKSAAKEFPDTIDEMRPLYAAVAHGCQGGRYQEAFDDVYWKRIYRPTEEGFSYSMDTLGAVGSDLAAMAVFFDDYRSKLLGQVNVKQRHKILHVTAFCLQNLGRLNESIVPMSQAVDEAVSVQDFAFASSSASNLSQLHLMMGEMTCAVESATKGIELADKSEEPARRVTNRATLANVLHQNGKISQASELFGEAREIDDNLLDRNRSFQYCEFLLTLGSDNQVKQIIDNTIQKALNARRPLNIGLNYLIAARLSLMTEHWQEQYLDSKVRPNVESAIEYLRRARTQDHLPFALLTRAQLHRLSGDFQKAHHDLNEAMTIATRGGMRLHEADCHLEYARLFLTEGKKDQAREHLTKADTMIDDMGYHRRDPEIQLAHARLSLMEGNKQKAEEHLQNAKELIEKMKYHSLDREAAEIEKEMGDD